MPSAKDIKLDDATSFFLIGDGGTGKTSFIGTCPKPVFNFDTDNGMARLAGQDGIEFETYKELDQNVPIAKWQEKQGGWYEWGTAYPKIKAKLSEIGKTMDTGECKYKTIGIDSLTLFYDLLFSYTEKERGSPYKDGRQQWGDVLDIATSFYSQFTNWPIIKVVTTHVQRVENKLTQGIEKLPLIGGKFSGKAGILFDEVYYTERVNGVMIAHTVQDGSLTQAKSRKYNLPDKTELNYNKIMEQVRKTRVHAA
jgi:hypothetical protein